MASRAVAFEGIAKVDLDDERSILDGLAKAIHDAAMSAAEIGDLPTDEDTYFHVSSIQIAVSGNPGPKAYKVVITPGG